MLNYKRFTFNYRHSVFYCISKYYLHRQAHFRDHRHARQQCTLAGRVRHARPCLHTYDAALCSDHEQQPERGDEQCEGTSGMVNMQPARH